MYLFFLINVMGGRLSPGVSGPPVCPYPLFWLSFCQRCFARLTQERKLAAQVPLSRVFFKAMKRMNYSAVSMLTAGRLEILWCESRSVHECPHCECAESVCVCTRMFVFGRIGRPRSGLEEITLQAYWVKASWRKYPDWQSDIVLKGIVCPKNETIYSR